MDEKSRAGFSISLISLGQLSILGGYRSRIAGTYEGAADLTFLRPGGNIERGSIGKIILGPGTLKTSVAFFCPRAGPIVQPSEQHECLGVKRLAAESIDEHLLLSLVQAHHYSPGKYGGSNYGRCSHLFYCF